MRILVEGHVGAGDEIRVVERPGHDLTVRDVLRIYAFDREEVGRLLTTPGMSEGWRWWAENTSRRGRATLQGQRLPAVARDWTGHQVPSVPEAMGFAFPPLRAAAALSGSIEAVEHRDQDRAPMATVTNDSPNAITGGIELVGVPFGKGASREHYTLCRCGASKN